jgi:PII-like signaling protein
VSVARGGDALKLSLHLGERDRHGNRSLADAVMELFERRELAAGVLLRGAEGFGAAQRLRTDRLLSLSEDLPLLAVAVDRAERIEPVAAELREIAGRGLLTLERARLGTGAADAAAEPHEEVKLTVYTGRRARRGGAPAHVGVVAALHGQGVAGATSLLGVDGVASGRRLRARFFAANGWVPTITVAVGERRRIAAALAELEQADDPPLSTLEAIRTSGADGPYSLGMRGISAHRPAVEGWTRVSVYCSEGSEYGGVPLYLELIRRLRSEGAAGATALRGVWGYHGDHAPHGDRLLGLRRRVPIVVSALDTASRSRRWLEIAAELTAETGLLTVETVPRVVNLESLRQPGPEDPDGGCRR